MPHARSQHAFHERGSDRCLTVGVNVASQVCRELLVIEASDRHAEFLIGHDVEGGLLAAAANVGLGHVALRERLCDGKPLRCRDTATLAASKCREDASQLFTGDALEAGEIEVERLTDGCWQRLKRCWIHGHSARDERMGGSGGDEE